MSRKHAELEREFLDELELRTGRALAAWMKAIDAAGVGGRNAIIDWLRPQGLTFAHASWLERIHHNAGRPIYIGVPPAAASPPLPLPPSPPATPPALSPALPPKSTPPTHTRSPLADLPLPPTTPARTASSALPQLPSLVQPAASDAVVALLARGKGLRPLADHVLREIQRAVPGVTITAAADLISIAAEREFAVLAVAARDLRLGLALRDAPTAPILQGVRIPGAGSHITRMAILDDARQVDAALIGLVLLARSSADPI